MIFVENEAHKILVKTLGVSEKEIIIADGKGNVCNKLEKERNCKGLVDEDPLSSQHSYFKKLGHKEIKNDLKLSYDQENKNYLIILCPTVEKWILKAAIGVKIDISKYNLPSITNELYKVLHSDRKKYKNLEDLIKDVVKQKSVMLKTLERFLKGKN
jgi:hypothetical protein